MQIKYNKTIYLILLLMISTVYYSFFSFSVISPQMGWWQYYAYCLINGDLLYKDVYVYLPPYFPLFTTGLYYLFENNFLYYSIFGFVFIRCVAWSILYLILTRLSIPLYSFVSVFLGICITSSYLMDQPYDYNPAIFTLVILLLYFFIKLNETRNDIYIISSGMIVGILFMTKQTVGIILPLVVCILLYIQYKEDNLKKKICYFLASLIVALLPGIVYLIYTNTFYDMLSCLAIAASAKVANSNVMFILYRFFVRIKIMLFIGLSFFLLKANIKSEMLVKIVYCLLGALFGFISVQYIIPGIKYIPHIGWNNMCALVCMCCICVYFYIKRIVTITSVSLAAILLCLCMVLVSYSTDEVAIYIYENMNFRLLVHDILYASLYLNLMIIMYKLFFSLRYCKEEKMIYLNIFMIFGSTLLVSAFSAAECEPYLGLFLVPLSVNFVLIYKHKNNMVSHIKNISVLAIGSVLVFLCLITKMYMPFEWHGWRSSSILSNNTTITICDIPGINGYTVSVKDYNSYKLIYELIKNHSNKNDKLYQFPNISLFNVLLERKSYYIPIAYFDVCPDDMAKLAVKDLEKNKPELFLWADFSNERWKIHEDIFRGGQISGQRELKRFYKDIVLNDYQCLGVINNNEGENIELWKCK